MDDVTSNRIILKRLLDPLQLEVAEAASGRQALDLVPQCRPALILLDVQMPEMNGYEVADALHKKGDTRHIPIIFITAAYQDEFHQMLAYDAGAVDYIEKPLNDKVLLSKVKVFLELHAHKQRLEGLLRDLENKNTRLHHEITERLAVEQQLFRLSQVVEQSPAPVIITNLNAEIEFVNHEFEKSSGYRRDEVTGQNPRFLKSGLTPQSTYDLMWESITNGKVWRGELHNRRKDGSLYWEFASISPLKNMEGEITHYVAVKEDITLRKEYEARLLRQSNFDEHTGLPNRILALDRLSLALATSQRDKKGTALLFVDLDNFKKINETRGHALGDEILLEASRRLSNVVRKGDTVARFGGDEFLLILPDCNIDTSIEAITLKVLNAFSEAFHVGGEEFMMSASVGISIAPTDGDNPEFLLQSAEAAMYRAKDSGRNTYCFFTREMNEEAAARLEMENFLHKALSKGELSVYYQPQIEGGSGKLVGVEALLRWHNAKLGEISPEVFIPIAESTGLIESIGEWVMYTAVGQVRQWQLRYQHPLRVAVNFSSRQFFSHRLTECLEKTLNITKMDPACLEMELTESLLMQDTAHNLESLKKLSGYGVRLSIDDFGTGYSSLHYLKKFPIHVIKIDKSFIHDLHTDPDDAVLVKAIIAMSHGLGLHVVAEGVETPAQAEFLRAHDCDLLQGYYFSPPLPPREFEAYLSRHLQRTLQ